MVGLLGVSPLAWALSVATGGIGVAGVLALFLPGLSVTINDLVTYGKSPTKGKSGFVRGIQVPKRWFTHFYIVAVVSSSFWLTALIQAWYGRERTPLMIRDLAGILTEPNTRASVDGWCGSMALGLVWLHSCRRLCESLFVSVYSDTEMNLLHYAAGLAHYTLLPLVLCAEVAAIADDSRLIFTWSYPSVLQTLGVAQFLLCSYGQHQCLKLFAACRKNHQGNITNYGHCIPYGGWFELVSCPHFLFEIGIYLSLAVFMSFRHWHWWYVVAFVVVNQTIAALITHKWYQERFGSKYPQDRKAIIPFLL